MEYKKIFKFYGIPLVIFTLLLFWLMYYYMFLANVQTSSTAYLDKATYSDEDKYFVEVSAFDNSFEIIINYYTDTDLPEKDEEGKFGTKVMYSTGAQFIDGVQWKKYCSTNQWNSFFKGSCLEKVQLKNGYYYDTEMGGQSFASLKYQGITNQNNWIWDIKGELCRIKTKNADEKKVDRHSLWVTHYNYFDTSFFIQALSDTVKSVEAGDHIFYLDLSQYFFVTLGTDIKEKPTDDKNYLYIPIKVTKNNGRMTTARQSLFGRVKNDPNWTLNSKPAESYWKNAYNYDLTLKDFNVVFENGGYYLKLKADCEIYLKNFEDLILTIEIDLDSVKVGSMNVDIAGFSENLYQFELYKLILHSEKSRTFELKAQCIVEADSNITITYAEVADDR